MTTRLTLLLIVLAFLLLNTGAGALAALPNQIETEALSKAEALSEAEALTGGSYQLTLFPVQTGSAAAGGAYRLLGPAAPELRGSGCCCVYLPCTLRKH